MNATGTKIFGMRVGIDPKILVGALLAVAILVYYFNSKSDDRPSQVVAAPAVDFNAQQPVTQAASFAARSAGRRAGSSRSNVRAGLKLVPIDGSRGDIDPRLRLQLLERVRSVAPSAGLRNLFEGEVTEVAKNLPPIPKNAPILTPKPLPDAAHPPPPPPIPFSIPLKYYGFAKPSGHSPEGNRGLFLDGENILMGGEGDTLERRYLIVTLTANSARLEDTQMKHGQELPVTPAAQ